MKRISNIKKSIAARLELAPEAAGSMRLTLIDNAALCIENYRSIVEYTQQRVRIHVGAYDILVCGAGLELKEFGGDILSVHGQIASVEYKGMDEARMRL